MKSQKKQTCLLLILRSNCQVRLLELVRYIHLNPLRAHLVKTVDRPLTDDRILGTGEFVRQLIEKTNRLRHPYHSLPQCIDRMAQMIALRCRYEGISLEALTAGSKAGTIPKVRQTSPAKSLMSLVSSTLRLDVSWGSPHRECQG